jgi:hypothetical protein
LHLTLGEHGRKTIAPPRDQPDRRTPLGEAVRQRLADP